MTHHSNENNPQQAVGGNEQIDRREFLARVGAAGVVALGAGLIGRAIWNPNHRVPGFEEQAGIQLRNFSVEIPKGQTSLAIVHGSDRKAVVKAAFDALGGVERFIKKGDRVLIKPNVAFDRPPALGATTHPDTVRAVAELVKAAGAREILIADNPINSPAGCFLKSGITAVANDMNLTLCYPEPSAFQMLKMKGEILTTWSMFYGPLAKADKVIGVAPCKDHNLCHASMTMKNWYGLLGGRRNQFHQHIYSIVADFALMIKPTLVILDGMNVLMSNGPTGGRLSDVKAVGAIVAGTDMVAVDACGYQTLLGRDLAELEYVHKATSRGLGDMNWKNAVHKEIQA